MLFLGIIILSSYFIGSINGGLILSRLKGLDIRKKGSGNAGATNVLRVIGLKSGAFVPFKGNSPEVRVLFPSRVTDPML